MLTSVHLTSFADFFPLNDPLPSVQEARNTRRTSFAVDYHYCSLTGELTISGNGAGAGVSKCQSASRHCSGSRTLQSSDDESQSQTQTGPTSRPERTNSSHHLHSDSHIYNISALLYSSTLPHVSAPFILHAKAGDPVDETADEGFSIMLPSFPEADATLLSWEIYREVAELPLRMRAVDESTVQIWPDSKYWVSGDLVFIVFASRSLLGSPSRYSSFCSDLAHIASSSSTAPAMPYSLRFPLSRLIISSQLTHPLSLSFRMQTEPKAFATPATHLRNSHPCYPSSSIRQSSNRHPRPSSTPISRSEFNFPTPDPSPIHHLPRPLSSVAPSAPSSFPSRCTSTNFSMSSSTQVSRY